MKGSLQIKSRVGPVRWFVAAMTGSGRGLIRGLKALRDFCADFTVLLTTVQVAGVAAERLLHRGNPKRPMGSRLPSAVRTGGRGAVMGLLLAVAGGYLLGMWAGAGEVRAEEPAEVDLNAIKDLLPLEEIIVRAKAQHDGQLIEAELKNLNGTDIYETEILDESGKVWEMHFNARTGELVKQEEEQQGQPNENPGR